MSDSKGASVFVRLSWYSTKVQTLTQLLQCITVNRTSDADKEAWDILEEYAWPESSRKDAAAAAAAAEEHLQRKGKKNESKKKKEGASSPTKPKPTVSPSALQPLQASAAYAGGVYAEGCWRMLTDADVCWRMLTYADVCWRMLTDTDGCCRMLTYADGC